VNETTRPRRRWSLQTRLIAIVVGLATLMVVAVGVAISAIIGQVMQDNLTATVSQTAQDTGSALLRLQLGPVAGTVDAAAVLAAGPRQPGVALVVRSADGEVSGAYAAADGAIRVLSDEQIVGMSASGSSPDVQTVEVPGLGEYRMTAYQAGSFVAVVGLPVSEVESTLAQIASTVAIVTVTGLVAIGVVLAVVIRQSLRPLREVADTAARVSALPLAEGAVRITERVPDAELDEVTEIGRVGTALNTLLDHVDASLEARRRNEERMRRFVADASHELRTPLASIRGYSELTLRNPDLDETTQTALARIQAQSLRMGALVDDLLLLARLEEGQELVSGTVDMVALAVDATADARAAGPEHVWVLRPPADPVTVVGDETRLHQVFANLLANARTHTPAGTTVTIEVARDGDGARVTVHDDGPGIDPDVAEELFERFARADRSRARGTGGTGLGLAIARAIVHAHGGAIRVTSRPGDTTFTVILPPHPPREEGAVDAAIP
jgi:two-component system OmpR family sensor kinase